MAEIVAKANVGPGTDKLLTYPNGLGQHAGAVVLVDTNGDPIASLPVSASALEQLLADIEAKILPAGQATMANSSPVAIASDQPAIPVTGSATSTPPATSAGLPVRQIGEEIWACSFSQSGASVLASDLTLLHAGTGVTYSQASGSLLLVAGTTANSEFLARSTVAWQGSMLVRAATALSQRIANNNFAVLLADLFGEALSCTINSATSITITKVAHGLTAQNVGQFMFIGGISGANGVPGRYAIASVPTADTLTLTVAGWPASGSCTVDAFGRDHVKLLYTGTTATNVAFDAQRNGWATGDTTAAINTTASPGHVAQLHLDGRDIYFSDTLRASSTTPTVATRASRYEGVPEDGVPLYLFLWMYNGTTSPATSTTWTVGFLSVERYSNFPVYIQGNRMQGAAAPMPVSMQGTGTVTISGSPTLGAGTGLIGDVGIQYRANATGAASINHVVSAAGTNAANVKASAGRVVGWSYVNTTVSFQYVKLHNTAGTPTAGSGVVQTIAIPPNGVNNMPAGFGGIGFATGIGRTIVTGSADADATATTAGSVVGDLFFA